ncbi:hypothetical protein [Arachnia propionica]|uniref:hypothetical protein n=1 Tax=Arachnia propionica TaxID=1750 RepID=UPI003C701896
MSTSPEADKTPEPPDPEPLAPAPELERPLLTFKIRCRDGVGYQNLLFSLVYILVVAFVFFAASSILSPSPYGAGGQSFPTGKHSTFRFPSMPTHSRFTFSLPSIYVPSLPPLVTGSGKIPSQKTGSNSPPSPTQEPSDTPSQEASTPGVATPTGAPSSTQPNVTGSLGGRGWPAWSWLGPVLQMLALMALPVLLVLRKPVRWLEIDGEEMMLSWKGEVEGQVALRDIAHMRLWNNRYDLEVYDRTATLRIRMKPWLMSNRFMKAKVDRMADQIRDLLHGTEVRIDQRSRHTERFIDFPPGE